MGVRDQELVQKLISLSSNASLQDVATCCRSYEATQTTASAIHASPSQMCAVSSYKKQSRLEKNKRPLTSGRTGSSTQQSSGDPNPSCGCVHGPSDCPTHNSTCCNCGHKGHWARRKKCPVKAAHATPLSCPHICTANACCCAADFLLSTGSPSPICIHVIHDNKSSQLHMLPNTGVDITLIGEQHLTSLNIPKSSL